MGSFGTGCGIGYGQGQLGLAERRGSAYRSRLAVPCALPGATLAVVVASWGVYASHGFG